MTSTQQLAVGAKLALGDIKASWMKYNHDCRFSVKIVQNIQLPQARYFSVCYSAPKTGRKTSVWCRAHVKVIGENRNEMKITSTDLNHTCEEGSNRRKRNYRTKDISSISNIVLTVYQPATGGNAKQFATMTKAATGVNLKYGQGNLAVKSKSDDTIEAHMGQYYWIPSLFKAYQENDPAGTYYVESDTCSSDQELSQFKRCYACLSIAKHFWSSAGIRLIACDGTHIVLITTTYNSNNEIFVLAFAIVDVENSDNWV
jgi:hypothetical protein